MPTRYTDPPRLQYDALYARICLWVHAHTRSSERTVCLYACAGDNMSAMCTRAAYYTSRRRGLIFPTEKTPNLGYEILTDRSRDYYYICVSRRRRVLMEIFRPNRYYNIIMLRTTKILKYEKRGVPLCLSRVHRTPLLFDTRSYDDNNNNNMFVVDLAFFNFRLCGVAWYPYDGASAYELLFLFSISVRHGRTRYDGGNNTFRCCTIFRLVGIACG